MATMIRAEISQKNKYWISKHRHYELKHFCMQYPEWKRAYSEFDDPSMPLSMIERAPTSNLPGDPTAKRAMMKVYFAERMNMVEKAAKEADAGLYEYILVGVTEGLSYAQLKARLKIPCGRDMYYERYRKFFWLLNESRQ